MATASRVLVSPEHQGIFHRPGVTEQAAAKASELLQENHENHHIFFNADGYHNHIAHHALTLYALAAAPDAIQRQYDNNRSYQRPPGPVKESVVEELHDPAAYSKYLGKEQYYHSYLVFFQKEIDKKGWEAVLNGYVFKGDDRADDMLVRMFAGFLHPIIHLGFGIEFKQPAIIAEALAQAAVSTSWMSALLVGAEQAAGDATGKAGSRSLVSLLDEIYADEKLSNAAHWDDGNKIRDGILIRAPQEMVHYAKQWTVGPEELEEKTAEMINAAGSAQRPGKVPKIDFYYMHCVNASIFFSSFLAQPWLSTANKVRLLEWKGRNDLAMYPSRHSPKPLLGEVLSYEPKKPTSESDDPWGPIVERVIAHNDDGHASKLVRALAHGQAACKPFDKSDAFRVKSEAWLKLGHIGENFGHVSSFASSES
ncbi:MAG: hypothetical protein M1833_002900 [Piccolia ochrophora]|nr:MAG: hypothetical protein M1833_002900 [Piccolia ochrophora]